MLYDISCCLLLISLDLYLVSLIEGFIKLRKVSGIITIIFMYLSLVLLFGSI